MTAATFLVQCLNAVQYGLLLFLVASGLTLIFGIMGVINLAHGSFYMLGAYWRSRCRRCFGDWFMRDARRRACVLAVIFGYLLEWAFFSYPLRARPPAAGADDVRADPRLRGAAQHRWWATTCTAWRRRRGSSAASRSAS